ncbi:SRPBCC family protein [Agarilytica rhodophyticola]|uniref:SRPBCC family protein n=1 Tax=Agarilytica rhodophyticola TaxID=1737490 RepID=UPI000B3486D9|nr:SRPBCC family protein [Agarilytica rhodophyticola]
MKFDVQKSTIIDAPISKVRELVEDFNHWNSWSPWTVLEPNCAVSVSGTSNKPGHSMSWEGEIIGSGKNTLRLTNPQQLHYDLEFFKPWKSKAQVSFLFEELDEKTKVTWIMNSSMPFFMFFMIKTMQNMIGMDYDRGLRMLKEMTEHDHVNGTTTNNGIVEYKGFSYVGIQRRVAISDMPTAMQKDFEKLVNDIVIDGKKGAMHWVCIYPKFDIKNMEATYIAAVSDEDLGGLDLGAEYVKGKINDGNSLEIKHDGAYDFLGNAWSMGMIYMRAKKIKGKDFPFEQYWNSPMEVSAEELKTSVYFPLKK